MIFREPFAVNQSGITSQFISAELDLGCMRDNHAAFLIVEGTSTIFTVTILGRWSGNGASVELARVDEATGTLPFTSLLTIDGKPARFLHIQVDVANGSLDLQSGLSSEV